jgi:hypothetical protein
MNSFAEKLTGNKPLFCLLLGDNFYPQGIMNCDSKNINECWIEPFLKHELLNVRLINACG